VEIRFIYTVQHVSSEINAKKKMQLNDCCIN